MFLPDNAIQSKNDDQLNRAKFAEQLGDTIRDWKRDESLVIALYGPWGSGKSSILNLTTNRIIESTKDWNKDQKPIIVWFNPWSYENKDQLLTAFFQQLLIEIRKIEPDKGDEFKKGLRNLAKTIGALDEVPVAGDYIKAGVKAINLFASEETLQEQKVSIEKLFRELGRRIIIVVDDIDRLSSEEIRLLFQIIKINADFPNTIYLTAFDRKVVEKALSTDASILGSEYLKKIVQVGFNVPKVEIALVHEYLFSELDKVLAVFNEGEFKKEDWAALYHSGFKDLFISLRDVKRYLNSLEMTLKMIHSEVNPVDYLGIEALRVFLPNVYQGIAENQFLFLPDSDLWDRQNDQNQEIRNQINEIFSKDGEELEIIAKKICIRLFPQIEQVFTNIRYGSDWYKQWRKDKRICSKDFFDVYFLLGNPRGEISQTELSQIISIAFDQEKLLKAIAKLIEENRFRKFVRRLRDKTEGLTEEQKKSIASLMLILAGKLPNIQEGIFDFGSDLEIIFLLLDVLEKMEAPFDWFRGQLVQTEYIYPFASIVFKDNNRSNVNRETSIFSDDQFLELKKLCIEKITALAHEEKLLLQKEGRFLLFVWKEWGEDKSLEKYVKSIYENNSKFFEFVSVFKHTSRSQTGYKVEEETSIAFENLDQFMSDSEIKTKLFSFSSDHVQSLSAEQHSIYDLLIKHYAQNDKEEDL